MTEIETPAPSSSPALSAGAGAAAGAMLASSLSRPYGGYEYGYRRPMGGMMPVINTNSPDGRASFTYFDPMELKPRDSLAATLSGAFGGGIAGAAFGGIPLWAQISMNKAHQPWQVWLMAGTALAGAAIGALTAYRNTDVHNKWADRFTRVGFEQPSGISR